MKSHYLFMVASLTVAFMGMVMLKDYTGMAVAQVPNSVGWGLSIALMLGFVVLIESTRVIYEH